MTIVVCPGFNPPEMTIDFLKGLGRLPDETAAQDIIYPADRLPPYSSLHLLTFLRQQFAATQSPQAYQKSPSLLFISFSAGVVAAIGAAHLWQAAGGSVKAMIAIDGWGVPLWDNQGGNLPIHRMSHDAFTHWSSGLLGSGSDGFYADPGVAHLDLWRSPQQVWGYQVQSSSRSFLKPLCSSPKLPESERFTTAAATLNAWLCQYGEGKIT